MSSNAASSNPGSSPQADADSKETDLSRAPLLAHLVELRKRLLAVLAFFAAAFLLAYTFKQDIYAFLAAPLANIFGEDANRRMIYTGLHEAFFTYLQLSFFAAVFATIPLALNQIWKFIAPGLYKHERRAMRPFFVLTPVLFLMGSALAYYIVFPLAWRFFSSFESEDIGPGLRVELEARVGEYLALVTKLILAFGLSFELPLLLMLTARMGMLTADDLARHRKHAVVIVFALAALITPPDVISQISLGIPVLILYEASIWLIRWMGIDSLAPSAALDKKDQ
ncbi:MAG: twin-arginine translocase subunit TatC [Pseudomonadota bacterium]